MATRYVVGCMTGTSLDAIDAALVRIEGEGLAMRVEVVRTASDPLRTLGKLLRPIVMQKRVTAGQVARYAWMLGMGHMILVKKLLDGLDEPVDLIAVHGQTIYHEASVSMQLINPHAIVSEVGVPVVFDFRGADLAAGGQGAPITPLADHVLFRDGELSRAVVNLGGFVNYTWLPATRQGGEAAVASIRGADICVCNQLLDTVARRCFKKRYDMDGQRAMSGQADEDALDFLTMMLQGQAEGGRSLGTGDEAADWVKGFRHSCTGEDLARTACAGIGRAIGSVLGDVEQVVLAGGGVRNGALVEEIEKNVEASVVVSNELGVDADYREAVAMAVLGALSADGVSVTLPQVTGRGKARVRGCWVYP